MCTKTVPAVYGYSIKSNIKNVIPQSHQPHIKNPCVAGGLLYQTTVIQTSPSLETVVLDSA